MYVYPSFNSFWLSVCLAVSGTYLLERIASREEDVGRLRGSRCEGERADRTAFSTEEAPYLGGGIRHDENIIPRQQKGTRSLEHAVRGVKP